MIAMLSFFVVLVIIALQNIPAEDCILVV